MLLTNGLRTIKRIAPPVRKDCGRIALRNLDFQNVSVIMKPIYPLGQDEDVLQTSISQVQYIEMLEDELRCGSCLTLPLVQRSWKTERDGF
ncbi:hypothetical protein NC651_018249 [Populus alba x Populus x berolinensis]|nr:hypothetical protein NC651_018249 [Populus alba x Populus x berolinensis]